MVWARYALLLPLGVLAAPQQPFNHGALAPHGAMSFAVFAQRGPNGRAPSMAPDGSHLAAGPKQFPPALFEPRAASWDLAAAPNLMRAALDDARCDSIRNAWPEIIRRTEATLRIADVAAFQSEVARLQHDIDALRGGECEAWQGVINVQRAFLEEHLGLHAPTHAADPRQGWEAKVATALDLETMRQHYEALHDKACLKASLSMSAAAAAWCEGAADTGVVERKQRYLINLATNDSLVHRDGSVGGECAPELFVAMAQFEAATGEPGSFASLQGQGPVTAEAKAAYLDAAVAYAKRNGLTRIFFVNPAEGDGQIPSFAAEIGARDLDEAITLRYIGSDSWRDGSLVTPKLAADFAAGVVEQLRGDTAPALVVVNCNAGLDRSGAINVLIRALSSMQQDRDAGASWPQGLQSTLEGIPDWVSRLKRARPHAISSWGRYLFLYQALDAYAAGQLEATAK